MNLIEIMLLVGGLAALLLGAELLVRGASRIALAFGIPPIIIGLTVVSLSTSAPEIVISAGAALGGAPDLAVGNVVGSNIANILLILGISAILLPVRIDQRLVRKEVPLLIVVSLVFWGMAFGGLFTRLEGAILLLGFGGYMAYLIILGRKESEAVQAEYAHEYGLFPSRARRQILFNSALVALGVILLVLGARWFVSGAEQLARSLGVSELIIGLTVVSLGTGMPELVTSVIAGIRKESDIAVGNIIGSNLFNMLAVMGITAALAPQGVAVAPAAVTFDIPVMIASAVACLPIFYVGYYIFRWEGFLFVGYYVAYVVYLILAAAQHDALPMFSSVMLEFVIPLTAVTLGILVYRTATARRRSASIE
jgi:cation:H+ antiporter